MRKRGYSPGFAAGIIAAGGTLLAWWDGDGAARLLACAACAHAEDDAHAA